MANKRVVVTVLTLLLGLNYANELSRAQTITQSADPAPTIALPGTSDFAVPRSQVYQLAFVALIGLATLALQGVVLVRSRASMQSVTRLTIITLIIILAVGTLVMGYNEAQIAPVIGLFGSIVGYLLGRGDRGRRRLQRPSQQGGDSR